MGIFDQLGLGGILGGGGWVDSFPAQYYGIAMQQQHLQPYLVCLHLPNCPICIEREKKAEEEIKKQEEIKNQKELDYKKRCEEYITNFRSQ